MGALMDIASASNGYVTSMQATDAGIPRRKLREAVSIGDLVQLDRGLYALPDVWEDPLFILQHRFSRGVFSDDTALFLLGMTDRAPFAPTMTFPRSYNASSAREAGVISRTCVDDVLDLGLCNVETEYGNTVRAYDVERTLCDLVRGQGTPDLQIVSPAMKAYVQSRNCDPMKLVSCARALGVEVKIRNYLEVLL
ncbi:type IV toxin-antitoxin system AbiEi family antitoxin domain-containing protein [Collinsella sp. AGMB00827]|uniref:Type IV toxin-antitoxin system AbiEi family antitoxin domain-containing protein n=1 Tax=Collinsella ureilytica TaxID=2869515 RepID=A0ABS7MIM3_9ACTN|nr:type IV toxin-antitoxin system AbiEi family antitoxin domain-containing protein [Collinsella urealyticum]MBY4797220.1 type IV toxin-antitoxin system AbiEi family antitoxin domain-containing protein [Collinsella urealyticum]